MPDLMPAQAPDAMAAAAPAPRTPWRLRRRAFALALLLHLLVALFLLRQRVPAAPPLPPGRLTTVVMVRLPSPKPPPPRIRKPVSAGIKLARRPNVGLPRAKTIEHELATLPASALAPVLTQVALTDPLPNLAAIDVAAGPLGTGGTGRAGTGAGASGKGGGSGKLFEACADTPDRAMVADVYRLAPESDTVNAMRGKKPIKQVCLSQLNVAPRSFLEGFPGMNGMVEWFGLDIRFTVNLPDAGTRDIVLISDDGAILTIDDVEVIDNDGRHKPERKIAQVILSAGVHRFRVRYFQGPREMIALQLGWRKAGEERFDYIARGLLGRP